MVYKELTSNQYYSLSELFSTPNRKIIIPDFQRDYCWGDKTHGLPPYTDIASGFIDTLLDEFKSDKKSDLLLGKIDVYEHPKNHIYLTDGQQRLTTLYLLMGMLYKNERSEPLRERLIECLVSKFEAQHDDKEPYLQYAVRETTIFFLRDLVNEFFLNDKLSKVAEIQKPQSWFFREYTLDPSIRSMLSALETIEGKLKNNLEPGFSEFVIEKIKIQYYDVIDKQHGEERFVIINTTGEGLTVTENIKPILLGNTTGLDFARQWEERETFFWHNRLKEKEAIADNGVNDFLTWCFRIIDRQEEFDIVKKAKELLKKGLNQPYLIKIEQHYKSLQKLIEWLHDPRYQPQFKFINEGKSLTGIIELRDLSRAKQQNILLPAIAYISKFGERDFYQFLRRLRKNYFDLKWEDRQKNYLDWRYVLQIIEKSDSPSAVFYFKVDSESISNIQNVKLADWFNVEEYHKHLFQEQTELLREWEDHPDFMGDLSSLFTASLMGNEDDSLPILAPESVVDLIKVKKLYSNYKSTVDLIRSEEQARTNSQLANMFRLFRLFIGCTRVGHIYKASWEFEGVLFSTPNRVHLFKKEFLHLINADDILLACTLSVKQKIKDEDLFNLDAFRVDKLIKAWLTLKVFYANANEELLVFYDGNETGVAAYIHRDDNKLIDEEEFSLANSICGFGKRSGFGAGNYVHTTSAHLWCRPNIIDTPFSSVDFLPEKRTKEQLTENGRVIESIINSIHI